jgi:predicted DsbA family dithiol-disulfide isomerase
MITLDILSDPICPWCYIGKAHLDRALEARPDHPFLITWAPFQLNPAMPRGGVDRRTYLEQKFGGKATAVQAYAPVVEAAAAAGVTLNLEAITRTPNTLDAHRLILWAGLEGRQSAVVSALFRAYFSEGRDIGDAAVLATLAGAAGMNKALVTRLLATDADEVDIMTRDRHAREKGVTGVPCFIVANSYALSGAQPPQVWDEVLAELAAGQDPHH